MSLSYKCIMLQRLYKRRLGEWGEVIFLISIGGVRGCKLNCVKACRESLHSPLSTTRTCAQNLTSAIIRSSDCLQKLRTATSSITSNNPFNNIRHEHYRIFQENHTSLFGGACNGGRTLCSQVTRTYLSNHYSI